MNHIHAMNFLAATSALASATLAAPPTWEDAPLGATFATVDATSSDGVDVVFDCFQWSTGTIFCGGSARVDPQLAGCNAGQRISLNNINARFDYAGSIGPVTDPVFNFGEYGGNMNLIVNGDARNFNNFLDLDGSTVGGCVVRVLTGGGGSDCGKVQFEGVVDQLTVGGQEFWWDGTPDCDIAFEDLPLGAVYPAVSMFAADGVPVTVRELFNPSTPPTFGNAIVGNGGMACGIGHELWTNNCRAGFDFLSGPGSVQDLSFEFGEYGGHINFAINGDLRIVADFKDLDGAMVGGTTISVPSGGLGNDCGELYVSGMVHELEVGGQELWIDCLRFESDPNGGGGECEDALVDHADLPLAGNWAVGDSLTTNGVHVSIHDFISSSGPVFGNALTSNAQLACGDDLELATYNVHATYDFAGSIGALVNVTVQLSDQAGEINLGVNGVPVSLAADYADLHGTTSGGATILVESGGYDGDCTVLRIMGTVKSLTLGGQQHFIDCIWADDIIPPAIPGDLNGDGCVDSADVGLLLGYWGTPMGDLNGDGTTDAADFGTLLGNWGC